jgi:error-prone DNA polymerase
MSWIELRARTAFSFGDGTATPEALMDRVQALEMPAVGLSDAGDLGGVVRFALAAQARGIKPIIGAELRVDGRPLALIARGQQGYQNLAGLITRARLSQARGEAGLPFSAVAERADDLFLLTGPHSGFLATTLREQGARSTRWALGPWREAFGDRLRIEVQLHRVSRDEAALAEALVELAEAEHIPWVATNEPRYLNGAGRRVHDLQTALRHETTYADALSRGLLLPNGEWRLKGAKEMAALWPGRDAGLAAAREIAEECDFSLRWCRPPLPSFPRPSRMKDDDAHLRLRVLNGANARWGTPTRAQLDQLDHELAVIRQLGFAGFFLIMWDACRWARERGILCQGRGSAANSAVAFCLGITAVDPLKYGLLFERFLSEARTDGSTEAPDIDVDFEKDRREEVLDYVYNRWGRGHAAITGVTQVYHAPSALQDMGRALGYDPQDIFRLSKRIHWQMPSDGVDRLEAGLAAELGVPLDDTRGRALCAAMRALDDVPRMRSTHPGGFVLCSDPLGEYLPIERTSMGRTIIQFDKDDLDAAGVPKFDFLGLGGLTAVRLAFDAIEARTGHRPEIYGLPENDPKTFDMISKGDTLGTFQIESRAQISSVVQTRPDRMYDIVVQVALIRPGPIVAEFVRPYTRRRRGQEEVEYAHPDLKPILERTQGICIFQEQAMAVSMALGGYTAAEADELRRAMGNSRKQARLKLALERLRERMIGRGVAVEVAERIADEMRIFGNYGFPESHAWSFALIAYATAYLKAHHPAEFLLGLLNAQPMGFYSPATLVHDARRHRVRVLPPCLRGGRWDSTLEETDHADRPAVRLGARLIRGLGEKAKQRLQTAWEAGPFTGIGDVVRRAQLNREEALAIAQSGGFTAFEPGRYAAAWEALRVAGDTLPLAPARDDLPYRPEELTGRDRVYLDYWSTGVCVDGHPMQFRRQRLKQAGFKSVVDLMTVRAGTTVRVAGLVVARQQPSTANGTIFLLLEDEHGWVNVIVNAELFEQNREAVKHSPFLAVEGRLEHNGPVLNLVGRRFRALRSAQLAATSRDFR